MSELEDVLSRPTTPPEDIEEMKVALRESIKSSRTTNVHIASFRTILDINERDAKDGRKGAIALTDAERAELMGFPEGHRRGCKCDICLLERGRRDGVPLRQQQEQLQRKQTVRDVLPKDSFEVGGKDMCKRGRKAKVPALGAGD